jgi:7-cyano-7-deazaguanine synthase in queuosine biosynthesis
MSLVPTRNSRTISARWDDRPDPLILESGRQYRLGLDRVGTLVWRNPGDRCYDLLHLAMSIYAIDRLAARTLRCSQSDCSRELEVTVGVTDLDFWGDDRVGSLVIDTLETLSEDRWDIRFVAWDGVEPESRGRLLGLPDDLKESAPLVCLYSGGLDSAAGLALRIEEESARPIIPVTVRHQSAQRKLVRDQYRIFRGRNAVPIHPLIVQAAMVRPRSLVAREETSQRTRAFLFSAMGGVAASLVGASAVEVFESGVGVVNLPFMAGMIGSRMTRSCHPAFYRSMSRLVSEVSGREIRFTFPFLAKTKGEMVRGLAETELTGLADATVSCVHYPLRDKRSKQCGACPACVLRRQAMFVAGIEEPTDRYRFDLFGTKDRPGQAPESRQADLKAILGQVVRLTEFDGMDEIPRRFRRHLIGSGVIGDDVGAEIVADLLRRYRREWLGLATEGLNVGREWATLLAPSNSDAREGLVHASV